MAKATFPNNILSKEKGTFFLGFYLEKRTTTELTLIDFSGIKLKYLNEIKLYNEENQQINKTSGDNLNIKFGYNLIIISYDTNKTKIVLINKDNVFIQELPKLNIEKNIQLSEEFGGQYSLMFTNSETITEVNNETLKQEGVQYKSSHIATAINRNKIANNPNPYEERIRVINNIFYRDFKFSNVTYQKKPYLEVPNIPDDESPILVTDKDKPLYRQYFFDHKTGKYELNNIEEFILTDYLMFELSYENIDEEYPLIIYINGELFDRYTLDKHRVFLHMAGWQHDEFYGSKVSIEYRLKDSYYVEVNDDVANYSYKIQTTANDFEELVVSQEGNSKSPVKLATEIELNPIVNPQHTGFMYIDYEEQNVHDFRLNVSSSYLVMDGTDSADFIVEAIDQYGNEVLSPYLDIFITDKENAIQTSYGVLSPVINFDTLRARNYAGRLYFKYRTPLLNYSLKFKDELFLNVVDRKTKLGSQISVKLKAPITVNKNNPTHTKDVPMEATLPFEYFARYYEKKIPAGHPLEVFDTNQDGKLTYDDWLFFKEKIYDKTFMNNLTNRIKEEVEE